MPKANIAQKSALQYNLGNIFFLRANLMSRQLAMPHQDPADRFLAATARVLDLTLVTADTRLLDSTEFAVMANR